MSAEPLPQPGVIAPATAMDLGHPIRYPIRVDDVWRSACRCHWWWALDADEAEAAVK